MQFCARVGRADSRMNEQPTTASTDGARPRLRRETSEQVVLETIFRDGPITRPEIAERTNLSKPTVSGVVSHLERSLLIHPSGQRQGRRGRKAVSYVVSDRAGFVVGVDVGGTSLRVAAADLYGEFICHRVEPTAHVERELAAQITDMVSDVGSEARGTHERCLALGTSTPGVVDQRSQRVTSLAYNVTADGGYDPLAVLRRRFNVPVLVDNNVNLAAVGEKWGGLARGVSSFVYIAVGAGVGMGIVIDDELVRGTHGAAGEIAYLPVGSDPFDERHRLRGGLEDEVGAAGILQAWRTRTGSDLGAASAGDVFDKALAGDEDARAVVDNVARHLGVAIATVCAVVDPELVVLGGGIGSNAGLLAPVRAAAAALMPLTARIETSLLENAALRGAVVVALREARREVFANVGRSGAQPAAAT